MRVGLDIGSTTIKCVVLNDAGQIVYSTYERHFSHILEKGRALLEKVAAEYLPDGRAYLAISGSAGMGLADSCKVPFVQEVFATRVAANRLAPGTDCIIELGGEDAKILFLTNGTEVRMNGSCAGGTGAFIDQMATLLKMGADEMDKAAQAATRTYTIASRCGVFAKSDIQPLINQGAQAGDIAASIYQAVVNQTIAGLAQGRPIKGNILYLGGPLTFSVTLSKWTLYSYITKGVFLGVTNKNLPRKGKKKNKGYRKVRAAHLPQGDSIEDRPEEIAERAMPGDWEMDTVVSCKKDAARLLVLTERMFRQEIIIKMPDGTTQSVVRSLDRLERKLGSRLFRRIFRTITVDNGSEFADCEGMERSCLTKRARTHIYYCHPYSAFERGSNENANSLIRRWLPKGTKLSEVSQAEIKQIQIWMNNYPRMVLGGRCANTALAEWMAAEGVLLPLVHI